MPSRIKSVIRRNATADRIAHSLANRLQPLFDFTSTHAGTRRGRKFIRAGDYFRRTPAAGYIGWVGNKNIGDEALFDAFSRLFPAHTPILYDRHPFELQLHRRWIKRPSNFFDFVALGGGTLFSYRPYFYQVDHAIHNNLPLMTFGTGLEDPVFYRDDAQRGEYVRLLDDWGKLLKDQPFIFVRGPRTAAILNEHGVSKVRMIGDPALTICTPRPPKQGRRVGINLGCDGKMWGNQADLNASVATAIRYLIDAGWEVDFIPMEPVDYQIGRSLARDVASSRFRVVPFANNPQAVLARFGECDVVIGQRLHAVILAAGQGIPTIALEYRPKLADFMESVGMQELSIRTDAAEPDRLIGLIDRVISRRETISEQLNERCNAFRESQQNAAQECLGSLQTRGLALALTAG